MIRCGRCIYNNVINKARCFSRIGITLLFGLVGCFSFVLAAEKPLSGKPAVNRFADPVLRLIYDAANRREGSVLAGYLGRREAVYRIAALTGLASVQDPALIPAASGCLNDGDPKVRQAAALALGRMNSEKAEPFLLRALTTEPDVTVKRHILEALGKCGGKAAVDAVMRFEAGENAELLTGQAQGLFRFVSRRMIESGILEKAADLISPDRPALARFYASFALARSGKSDLIPFADRLIAAYRRDPGADSFTRMNIAAALGRAVTPEIFALLREIIGDRESDYRVRVNALRSVLLFKTPEGRRLLLDALSDPHPAVVLAAAEILWADGRREEVGAYIAAASSIGAARSRAALYAAALTWGDLSDIPGRAKVAAEIREQYAKTVTPHDRAYWLNALNTCWDQADFIAGETFANEGNIIGTTGFQTLAAIGSGGTGDARKKEFWADIARKAVATGDPALVSMAAEFLRRPNLNFNQTIRDVGFLQTALDKCRSPKDDEAKLELTKTIAFLQGKGETTEAPVTVKPAPIDWELVESIPVEQMVRIRTSRGDIVIRLFVEESPASVANFVCLVRSGFFNKRVFHRVVPNFVVQDGCPRGDGWGSSDRVIASELAPLYYEEGSVGMASSGKDTESSQWFITHSPTPHLDGAYSIFGKVVSGMEIVHRLEVGDAILSAELLGR